MIEKIAIVKFHFFAFLYKMKTIKYFASICTVLVMLSANLFAQTSKTDKIKTLMELTGAANLSDQMLNQLTASLGESPPKSATDFVEAFRKELDIPSLMAQLYPIYEKHFTTDELDGLIAFYQTDLGKKVTATLPVIMQESMQIGQAWGKEAAERAMEKIKEQEEKD